MQSSTTLTPFHLAIQVRDLEEARDFYGRKIGLPEGRSSEHWIDFNLLGHQLVVHVNPALGAQGKVSQIGNHVDGHGVPVPHFGVVLEIAQWEALAEQVKGFVDFVIEPYVRFKGQPGEQATMFFLDPSGNALEFKAFRDIQSSLFAK
jgi:extradiol dioxygenase family protein